MMGRSPDPQWWRSSLTVSTVDLIVKYARRSVQSSSGEQRGPVGAGEQPRVQPSGSLAPTTPSMVALMALGVLAAITVMIPLVARGRVPAAAAGFTIGGGTRQHRGPGAGARRAEPQSSIDPASGAGARSDLLMALRTLVGSPDLALAPLGVGAVRSPGHGPHRAAPRRRCRGGAVARYERQGARHHLRLHAALLLRRSRRPAAHRRWWRPGAT